jgi:hypothetical protein
MKQILGILIIGILLVGCKGIKSDEQKSQEKVEFNQKLADELSKMAEIDQLAAANMIPPDNYKHLSLEEWQSFQDSVYSTHQIRLKEVFDKYGFVGYDLAGEKGSSNFWLMVQHSDHNPDFQNEVLRKMKIEVDKGNADSKIYGLLVDRVKINTGQAQVYGTQVDYKMNPCRAFPKNLADSANVNKRREEIGLQPLEEYLNMMALINCERIEELNAKEKLPKQN